MLIYYFQCCSYFSLYHVSSVKKKSFQFYALFQTYTLPFAAINILNKYILNNKILKILIIPPDWTFLPRFAPEFQSDPVSVSICHKYLIKIEIKLRIIHEVVIANNFNLIWIASEHHRMSSMSQLDEFYALNRWWVSVCGWAPVIPLTTSAPSSY